MTNIRGVFFVSAHFVFLFFFILCHSLFSKTLLFRYGPLEEGVHLLWSRENTVKSGFMESRVFVYDLCDDAISGSDFIV
jgi:hypothetical protein